MESRFCEFCNKEFQPVKVWQRFCSKKCWYKQYLTDRRFKIETRKCIVCDKEFQSTRKRQKFCTLKCYQKFYYLKRHAPKEKNCIHCDAIFWSSGKRKYCDSCREKYSSFQWEKNKNNLTQKKYHSQQSIKYQKKHPVEQLARRIIALKNKMIKGGGYKSNSKYSNIPLIILSECPHDNFKKHHHHPDYNKPFEIILLCHKCHREWHKKLRNQKGGKP